EFFAGFLDKCLQSTFEQPNSSIKWIGAVHRFLDYPIERSLQEFNVFRVVLEHFAQLLWDWRWRQRGHEVLHFTWSWEAL
ncbi:hypothetical protein EBB59_06000, partial [Lysobacter pythonis]